MGVGGKLLKYLPKPTSFSVPSRSGKHLNKAATFSGPIASIVPKEARRRKKNLRGGVSDTPEPTSPKVSCMGQVKQKSKNSSSKRESKNKKITRPSLIQRMFTKKVRPGRPPVVPPDGRRTGRFATGREALRDFEWRKEIEHELEEEVMVAHSAPITIGGGAVLAVEKKKEVNLWKRRTCAPPVPLEVHGV